MKPQSLNNWTAVTYPQDFSGQGAGLGLQTILRLQRMAMAWREGYHIQAIVLACGLGPDVGEYPRQTRPFSEMMKDWLISEGGFLPEMVHCSANHSAWNCLEVTLESIKLIKAEKLPQNVLVVSTGRHLFPRMWTTWVLLCGGRKDWRLAFAPAWNGTYDLWHELLGTAKYIPLALWYRFRNSF